MSRASGKSLGNDSAWWDEAVNSLCLLDLAEMTGGELLLSSMPPRDGELLLIRRIVLTAEMVQPEDVLWCFAGGPCAAELAFLRGAAGVVTARPDVQPWAGCFCLVVEDPVSALERLLDSANLRLGEESFCLSPELKVLQLPEPREADIYPLTCGRSAKGQPARRCQRRAA
jgi:hypothetical protein